MLVSMAFPGESLSNCIARKVGARDGTGLATTGAYCMPNAMETAVAPMMPISTAPMTPRAASAKITMRVNRVSANKLPLSDV